VTCAEEARSPLVIVVFGPGGVGKGTLVDRLVQLRDGLWLSRSWTTRPRRPGERDDAYVFASEEAFRARLAAGGFLEWNEFAANGHLYGTPTFDPPAGLDVLLEIDVNGAAQVARRYPQAVLVLVVAPSREAQEARLRARGDNQADVERRLDLGAEEELEGRRMAHFVVVNDDLERAAAELAGIVDNCRQGAR
jgi:guanylate kinase